MYNKYNKRVRYWQCNKQDFTTLQYAMNNVGDWQFCFILTKCFPHVYNDHLVCLNCLLGMNDKKFKRGNQENRQTLKNKRNFHHSHSQRPVLQFKVYLCLWVIKWELCYGYDSMTLHCHSWKSFGVVDCTTTTYTYTWHCWGVFGFSIWSNWRWHGISHLTQSVPGPDRRQSLN